jgi:hypothetical protein
MSLKPGLKAMTQKEKNFRRAHLQTINEMAFAECDNKKNSSFHTVNKTTDMQKFMIEIGALYGENYFTIKSIDAFNSNQDMVADKLFSSIPKSFCESNFVKDDVDFIKKGIIVGCRRKISNNFKSMEEVDNSIACHKILEFMKNDTLRFIDSISHEEVQNLIFLGRNLKKREMSLNPNIHNVWILTGYYDALYDTLDKMLTSLKNRSDNSERKVR